MNDRTRIRLITLLSVVVAIGLAGSVATAKAAPFRASGTDEITFFRGTVVEGISTGVSKPGGEFAAIWSGYVTGHKAVGVETWDFGNGDTLTFAWEMEFNHGQATGTYVITSGTGRFEGSTGSAVYSRVGHGDGTGDFVIEGTISR